MNRAPIHETRLEEKIGKTVELILLSLHQIGQKNNQDRVDKKILQRKLYYKKHRKNSAISAASLFIGCK
jgi:hypothetical protein